VVPIIASDMFTATTVSCQGRVISSPLMQIRSVEVYSDYGANTCPLSPTDNVGPYVTGEAMITFHYDSAEWMDLG